MIIVGNVSTKEEAKEVQFIAQVAVISQRARLLGRQA